MPSVQIFSINVIFVDTWKHFSRYNLFKETYYDPKGILTFKIALKKQIL